MPMTRFEIRNEFSLADSELYRAADKDDPEALLEGVAMAGLVGVLRQLGDLAEFAADIFHNLHEEVMVTAARGHSLMTRVRQLETEVPSIETAFLSQTDHSSFMYHAGVDWHPNLRTDTNQVTRVDLPRFVMDSYEECKAPPRLFLLDKFDIAGAGACLKRYTDPSFFKVETTDMTNADVQRERKILKLKKKGQGPRGRNGEMTEPSNTKLHQLFTDERTENGVNNHLRRVKLKRRLNGFPLDSKTGGSYMKKILKSPSPDHKVLHEVDVYPLTALMPARSDENESGLEAPQVRPASPDRVSIERDRSLHPSPERKEILLNPSLCEPAEATADDQIGDVSNSYLHFVTGGTSSTHDEVTAEKVIAIDADNNSEGSLTGYESNVVASEGETYMDATSVMEPEMDTEPEFTMKNDPTTSHTKSQSSISDANEEHDSTWISDCQSSGESLLSDEGNNSSRKEMSGCSPSDSANRISSADTPEMETVASLSFQDDADKGFMVDQLSQTVVSTDGMSCHTSDFEQQQTNLCINESVPTLVHLESEVIETENKSKQLEDDEISSTSHDDEKKTNIVSDQPCYPFDSDFESHSRDNSAGLTAGKHLVIEAKEASKQPVYDERASMSDEDEKKTHVVRDQASYLVVSDDELYCRDNSAVLSAGQYLVNEPKDEMVPCTSTVPDIDRPITDSSATSLDLLHEDGANEQDQYLVENEASTSNMFNVPSESRNDAPEMIPTTCPIPGESGDEFPKLIENLSSDYSDIPHNEDVSKPTVSQEEKLLCELDSEDSNASTHALSHSSGLLEVPSGQKLNGTSLGSSQTVNSEENCSNGSVENLIRSEKLMMLHLANSPDRPQEDLDADEEDVIHEQGTMGNGTLALESPTSGEIVGLPVEVITDCVFPGEPAETSDTVERDEINLHKSSIAEVTGISGSPDLKPPNEPDSDEGISNVETALSVCVLTDDTVADDAHSNMDLKKVVEHVHPEGSGLDELENYESSLSVSHQEFAGLVEKAVQIEAAASGSEPVFCNSVSDGHPKLEVSDSVPDSHLALEVDNRWESVDCITIQPILEPRGSSSEDEFFQQSGLGKTVLPPNELDQELSQSSEISSELPFLLSISQQKLQGHDDQKGENYSSPTVSLAGCPNPFSISELQRQSSCDVGGIAPFGSIFSLNNPFTERNQIELPPLPPLPPVQWRMGKSQQDSAPTEEGMIKHKELSPELVGPMNPSTDDVCFSQLNSFTDDVKTVPPTASVADVNTFPQIASSTDDSKNFPLMVSSDDAVASPQTVSSTDEVKTFPPTTSAADVNTSPQIASSADEIKKFPLTASSDDVVTSSRTASSTDDIKTFPPTASAADVNTSLQIASSTDDIKFPLMASSDNVVTSPRTALPIDDIKTFPPTASAADVNTSPKIALSTDDIKTFPPTASTADVNTPQFASSTDAEDAKVFQLIASADDVSNSPKVVSSTDDISSSPLMPSNNYVSLPLEEATHCPIQTAPMPESKEETSESKCSTQEMKDTQETANIVLNIEDQKQQQSTVPTPKGEFKSPEEDDGFSHESRTVKQPYPRNPLVDEVATLKLRKVTDRDRSQIQKGDERDAFLEQIRSKSFHLKPTMVPRPTIQHPKTNIRVAAILEKANAIRQALAGSDEDDDDCWSDS